MLPSTRDFFGNDNNLIFQQDNVPCHKAKKCMTCLRDNNVIVMDWPGQSPDLNPIENLWHDLGKTVLNKKPTNLDDLWEMVSHHWGQI